MRPIGSLFGRKRQLWHQAASEVGRSRSSADLLPNPSVFGNRYETEAVRARYLQLLSGEKAKPGRVLVRH